ncbi:hypothetical protein AA313_de0203300 [Arthrobotrys entomopaga]|nr:hypothetical protein AA313_de0203300 [Arthrobotrys entomopaga]
MASPTPEIPKVSMQIQKPGFTPMQPEEVEKLEYFFHRGGIAITKISPTVVVKYGCDVRVEEAITMDFIAEHTSIPVPRIYAAYTYGPFDRPDFDGVDEYETYIFMEYIEGETLEKEWGALDQETKTSVMDDLKRYLGEMRSIKGGTYVGSLDKGPVLDQILEYQPNKGPFQSVKDFQDTIVDAYCKIHKGDPKPFLTGMMNSQEHGIVFTHANFQSANIMIRDRRVVAIINWEMAGWYPEWWEFAKAFFIYDFYDDWGTHLIKIMRPYYSELSAHGRLMQILP